MKKIYLATILLSSCSTIFSMHLAYRLPDEVVIKDRLRYKISKHFGNQFGTSIGNRFIETTNIHTMAKLCYTPLSVASRAEGAANVFCNQHIGEAKALNVKKPLEQIILRELLKDYPIAIEALQSNYGLLPRKIR